MITHIDAGPSGFKSLEILDKQPWKPVTETNWVCGNSSLDTWKIGTNFNTRTFGNIFDSASIGTYGPVCIKTISTLRGLTNDQVLNEFYQCLIKFLCGNLNYHMDDTYKDALNYLSRFTFKIGTGGEINVTIPDKSECEFFVSKSLCAKYINLLSGKISAKEQSENSKGSKKMYENIYSHVGNEIDVNTAIKVYRILKYMGDKSHVVWTFYILYIDHLLRNNKINKCYKINNDDKFDIYTTPNGNVRWLKNEHIITLLTIDRLLFKSLIDITNKIKEFNPVTYSGNPLLNIPAFMPLLNTLSNKICIFLSRPDGNLPNSCEDLSLYNTMKKNLQDIKSYNFILCYRPEDSYITAILKLFDICKMIKKYISGFNYLNKNTQQDLINYFDTGNINKNELEALKSPYDVAIKQNEQLLETEKCSEFIRFCQDKLEINYNWNQTKMEWKKINGTIHYKVNKKDYQEKEMKRNNPTPNVEVGRRIQTIRIGSGADYNQINGLFSKCPLN